jgi:Family of unknown function (DUF6152)
MARTISIEPILGRAIVTLIAALMLVIASGSARAHHGWSEYDAAKRATITGTIDELHFANPHVTLSGAVSILLWIGVIISGRLIAYL